MIEIGTLPKKILIKDREWAIRSDFRVALNIFLAFNDPNLNDQEKLIVMLDSLYIDFKKMNPDDYEEATKEASWFLDGGKEYDDKSNVKKKVFDWQQDEQMIFSAVNKVANFEVRSQEYLHWWTFLGYFSEIGEGLFSTVLNIRSKKNQGKKLDTVELEFYRNNKELIDLKEKYSEDELKEIERLNNLFKK